MQQLLVILISLLILLSVPAAGQVSNTTLSTIALDSDVYSIPTGSTVARINILRMGSNVGITTVNCTTNDLTAISPDDYSGVAGRIIWPAGDVNTRQVVIVLKPEFTRTVKKQFGFSLFNVQNGNLGQYHSAIIYLNDLPVQIDNTTTSNNTNTNINTTDQNPSTTAFTECYSFADGRDYRGAVNQTINNTVCSKWPTASITQYPSAGLVNNQCRNPNQLQSAWCYIDSASTQFEYCNIGPASISSCIDNQPPTTIQVDSAGSDNNTMDDSKKLGLGLGLGLGGGIGLLAAGIIYTMKQKLKKNSGSANKNGGNNNKGASVSNINGGAASQPISADPESRPINALV